MNEAALRFLGLLNRGGKTAFGPSLRGAKKLRLLLLADDASANTRKELSALATSRGAPILGGVSKAALGQSLGREELSAVGILGENEAKAILDQWESKGERR